MNSLLKGIGFGVGLGVVLVGSVFAAGYFGVIEPDATTPPGEQPEVTPEPAPDTTAE